MGFDRTCKQTDKQRLQFYIYIQMFILVFFDYLDAVGRIDDYLPTDDESSCTSTPCTVQSGNISTTDCTAGK